MCHNIQSEFQVKRVDRCSAHRAPVFNFFWAKWDKVRQNRTMDWTVKENENVGGDGCPEVRGHFFVCLSGIWDLPWWLTDDITPSSFHTTLRSPFMAGRTEGRWLSTQKNVRIQTLSKSHPYPSTPASLHLTISLYGEQVCLSFEHFPFLKNGGEACRERRTA